MGEADFWGATTVEDKTEGPSGRRRGVRNDEYFGKFEGSGKAKVGEMRGEGSAETA